MDTEEDTLLTATKTLKRAIARAKHAKHQLGRFPGSAATSQYHDKSKAELREAYEALGVLLAEENLV